jgi:asparagine synthase (glutamine-hydrolysing)
MCGFVGFWNPRDFNADDARSLIRRMTDTIIHRGPDDEGYYIDNDAALALGFRRLSIIDLSEAGHQPMHSHCGRYVIVFNGEIYNHKELRKELEQSGCRIDWRGHSDTETLITCLAEWGLEKTLSKLNGIFAFAIWDKKEQSLSLARDGMGVKPFYYAKTDSGFAFASEIKALLQVPGLEKKIDVQAMRHYLTYLWCPGTRTMLMNVSKLEPGEAVKVKGGVIRNRFLHYRIPAGIPEKWNEKEAVEAVRSALGTAVERQMISDVPVGAFLSGGLDSSAITYYAGNSIKGSKLQCFTIDFDSKEAKHEGIVNDLPYAKSVANYLDVDLHTIKIKSDVADLLPEMIWHLDEPQADLAPINVLLISRLAEEHGIKVLLSGAGGDDIFTGYRRHQAVNFERYWSWTPRISRSLISTIAHNLPAQPTILRRVGKAFQYAHLEGNERIASYFQWLEPSLVDELFEHDIDITHFSEQPLIARLDGIDNGVPPLNKMLDLECRYFLADHNLNYTDKMSMACGVEVRVPFLDPDLVRLASTMPLHFKQKGNEGKWIAKKAMEGILPDNIIYRPKSGFGAPLRTWLYGPFKEITNDMLNPDSLKKRGWFDPAAVSKLLSAGEHGKIDAAYPTFAILCMELWGRLFLDKA